MTLSAVFRNRTTLKDVFPPLTHFEAVTCDLITKQFPGIFQTAIPIDHPTDGKSRDNNTSLIALVAVYQSHRNLRIQLRETCGHMGSILCCIRNIRSKVTHDLRL